jgi:hypothetical protein
VSLKEIVTFRAGCADAIFLFEESVKNYLDELRTLGTRHDALQEKLSWPDLSDDARAKVADELANIETIVNSNYPQLIEKFKPYLTLRNV